MGGVVEGGSGPGLGAGGFGSGGSGTGPGGGWPGRGDGDGRGGSGCSGGKGLGRSGPLNFTSYEFESVGGYGRAAHEIASKRGAQRKKPLDDEQLRGTEPFHPN
jgi:hypothetical protein